MSRLRAFFQYMRLPSIPRFPLWLLIRLAVAGLDVLQLDPIMARDELSSIPEFCGFLMLLSWFVRLGSSRADCYLINSSGWLSIDIIGTLGFLNMVSPGDKSRRVVPETEETGRVD